MSQSTKKTKYEGTLLDTDNFEEWNADIKTYLGHLQVGRCITNGWKKKLIASAIPILPSDPPPVPMPELYTDESKSVYKDHSIITGLQAEFMMFNAVRESQISSNKSQYESALIKYKEEMKQIKNDSEDSNTAIYAILQSIGKNLAMTYKSYDNPAELYKVINDSHSDRVHNSETEYQQLWANFGMKPNEGMDDYIARFRALVSSILAVGSNITDEPANRIYKLINGLDYRYTAAAQVMIIQNFKNFEDLVALMIKLGKVTTTVGQRNLPKALKAVTNTNNVALLTHQEVDRIRKGFKRHDGKTSSDNDPKGKSNPKKRGHSKSDPKVDKRIKRSDDHPKPNHNRIPYSFCGFCGFKHKTECPRGKGCNSEICHPCTGHSINFAKGNKTDNGNEDDVDDMDFLFNDDEEE